VSSIEMLFVDDELLTSLSIPARDEFMTYPVHRFLNYI
jgi:hypothetical protein